MSCILAFRRADAEAIPDALAACLKRTPLLCWIGLGAIWSDGETEWLLYHGDGWTLTDVAYCGWALAHVADLTGAETPETVRALADTGGVVLPGALDLEDAENPWQTVLEANYDGDVVVLMQGMPGAGWTQKGRET